MGNAETKSHFKRYNDLAGVLPYGAITEWMLREGCADESVVIRKDTGKIVSTSQEASYDEYAGKVLHGYKVVTKRTGCETNYEWCVREMCRINKDCGISPAYIFTSKIDSRFICLCRRSAK